MPPVSLKKKKENYIYVRCDCSYFLVTEPQSSNIQLAPVDMTCSGS